MKNKSSIRLSAFFALVVAFSSCQKVIPIDLNSSDPRYIVEGNITDQPGPYHIKITQSVNFDQTNNFPGVTGALVIVTDTVSGIADTLTEVAAGDYQTSKVQGVSGHFYRLYIKANNKEITSYGLMPAPVSLDSMYTKISPFGGDIVVVPVFTDPETKGNYYQLVDYKNATPGTEIFILDDKFVNGQTNQQGLQGRGDGTELKPGDRVVVDLRCIDSAVYKYYATLDQLTNSNSATPANPLSNFTGGALGYFSVHTVSTKGIVITP
jgi:hypothetical protein